MEILSFIFGLGIALSIFGFLWGLIVIIFSWISKSFVDVSNALGYVLQVLRYTLLVAVSANYILKNQGDSSTAMSNMILGVLVLGLYLMGKLQKRNLMAQFSQNRLMAMLVPKINPLVERYILAGSLLLFVVCLQYPSIVDNGIVNWFTKSISDIYNTPVIGWIFAIIAFFFLINTLLKGASVIGSLITGQPINNPNKKSPFGSMGNMGNASGGSNPFDQFRQKQQQNDGFVDYEDVTDVEDTTYTDADDTPQLS